MKLGKLGKPADRQIINNIQVKEVVKTEVRERVVEPKFEPIKQVLRTDAQTKEILRKDLLNLDKNVVTAWVEIREYLNLLNNYVFKLTKDTKEGVNLSRSTSLEVKKDVVQTTNALHNAFVKLTEEIKKRDQGLIIQVDNIRTEVMGIKQDRLSDLDSTLKPYIDQLFKEFEGIKSIPAIETGLIANQEIFRNLGPLVASINDKFSQIDLAVTTLSEKADKSIDPNIQAFYTLFTQQMKDFEGKIDSVRKVSDDMLNIKRDLERIKDNYEKRSEEMLQGMIERNDKMSRSMEAKHAKLIQNVDEMIESFQIAIKEGKDKVKNQHFVNNNTYNITNEIKSVMYYDELPGADIWAEREFIVKKTTFWPYRAKGKYYSDGHKWWKV